MADKDPNLENPDLDDDLDIPEFDDSLIEPGKSNRKPIERAKGGFYEGVKRNALSRNTQRKVIDEALPKGYGKAYDDALSAVDLGQELYDTARENLVPVKRDLKKIGRFVAGRTESILPGPVQRYLEELVKPEDNSREILEKIDEDRQQIQTGMQEVFGDFLTQQTEAQRLAQEDRLSSDRTTRNILRAQLESNLRKEKKDSEKELKDEVIGESRWETESNLLNMMRSGIERLVDYQDRITASYQRKSLELQYRQFFVARDHYTLTQGFVSQTNEQLNAIVNNTALPEFLKTQTSEAARAMLRERALGNLGQMVSEKTSGFQERLKSRIGGLSRSLADGIQGISDNLEMAADAPVDKYELTGGVAGETAAAGSLPALARRLGARLGRSETIARMGSNLDYYSDNKAAAAQDYLRSLRDRDRREGFGGLVDSGRAMAAEGLLSFFDNQSPEATYGRDATVLAEEAAPYTSLADKSITEIIPGLLTDILHEAEMIRTGDDTTERRIYDFETGEIRRQSAVQKRLVERALPEGRMESIRDDLMTIVDRIDPDQQLSEAARLGFTRQLLTDASNGRRFDPTRFFQPGGLTEVEDEDILAEIRHLIKERFLRDDGQFRKYDKTASALRAETSRIYTQARDDIPNYQEVIGRLMPLYGARTLREAGLVEQEAAPGETRAGVENILDYINTGEGPVAETPVPGASTDELSEVRRPFGPDSDRARQASERDRVGRDAGVDTGGLDRVVGILERFVEVQRSVDLKRQFEHVLNAIAKINPREHLELNGKWLKDIYELLRGTLGGGPGGGGPSGGPQGPEDQRPQRDFSRSPWNRRETGAADRELRRINRWRGETARAIGEGRDRLVAQVTSLPQIRAEREEARNRAVQQRMIGEQRVVGGGSISVGFGGGGPRGPQGPQGPRDASNDDTYAVESLIRYLRGDEPTEPTSPSTALSPISDEAAASAMQRTRERLNQWRDQASDRLSQGVEQGKALVQKTSGAVQDMSILQDLKSAGWLDSGREKTQELGLMGRAFMDRMAEQMRKRFESHRAGDEAQASQEQASFAAGDDYWNRARGLLEELMAHMDRKTEQLQDSIENLTLAQMAGDSEEPGALKRLGRGAAKGLGGIMSFYGGMWKSAGNLAAGGTGMVRNLVGGLFKGKGDSGDGIMDIYLKGQTRPVMLARDLRAGRYFDQASGDVIQRIDEITGPVVDEQGDVVISQFDIDEGLLVNRQGKSLMDRVKGATGGFASYMTSPYRLMFGAGKKVLDVARNLKNRPRDIYVKGEQRPRMLAVVMKNGGYLSQATGKPIRSIQDIDGAVVDRQGNVVLSHEDIQQGLIDSRGKTIRSVVGLAGKLVKGAVSGTASYLMGSYKLMGRAAKGAVNLVTGRGGDGESDGFSMLGSSSKRQTKVLEEIRDMLDERLEKPLRKGGWRSQLYGPKEEREKKAREKDEKDEKEGGGMMAKMLGMLGAGIAGLKDMFGGLTDTLGGLLDSGIDLGGGDLPDGDDDRRNRRRNRTRGRGGRMGRLWRGVKTIGGTAMRGIGSVAARAVPAVMAAAPAVASAAGTVASAAGSVLAGIGSAIAGVVSAPVLLTVGAVAAVGAGAYFAYRHFSRKPDGPLHRVRLAQYGADPDNKDQVGMISGVEEAMGDAIVFEGKRIASLGDGIDLEEVMEDFGVNLEDEVAVNRWLMWFQERFKPVYLSHVAVAKDMIDSGDLTDTEDMERERKRTYLRRTQFRSEDHPYVSVSPFPEVESLPGLAKVNMELKAALDQLPPPTEAQVMDERADAEMAEIERRHSRQPVIAESNMTPIPMATPQQRRLDALDRMAEHAQTSAQRQRIEQMRQQVRTQIPVDNVAAANDDPTTRVTGPFSETAAPTAEPTDPSTRRVEGANVIPQGRNVSAEQEAAEAIAAERARQERIARQTVVQGAANQERTITEMRRMVTILEASHRTQSSMNKHLGDINAYFQELRVKAEEDGKRRESEAERNRLDARFRDDVDEAPPVIRQR